MLLTLLILLQAKGASWLVWTVVIILFIIGISMIIYLSKRLKKGEEVEENWTLAQRSMINLNEPPKTITEEPDQKPIEEALPIVEHVKTQTPKPVETAIKSVPEPESRDEVSARQTQAFASIQEEPDETTPVETQTLAAVKEPSFAKTEILSSATESPAPPVEAPPAEPVRETRETEMLVSPKPESVDQQPIDTNAFGDEIWSEIESHFQKTSPTSESVEVESSLPVEEHVSDTESVEENIGDINYEAKVADRPMVEPLRVDSGSGREPFEPPTIAPLASHEQPPKGRQTQPVIKPTAFTPVPRDLPSESKRPPETRVERTAPRVEVPAEAATFEAADRGAATQKAAPRKVSGAVLGLPVDSSDQPLILGTPARSPEEEGIGSLTHYGRSADQEGGRWGTITLGLIVVLIVGGIAAYRYSPWFKSKMNGIAEKVVGINLTDNTPPPKPNLPRAQIFPRNGEASKNSVKARGMVINISEEQLTGLAVEVNLTRNDGSTEPRNVNVVPAQLAPSQQGIYEFEYDGKLYTGYSVSKLTSDGTEIKFIIPNRR